MFQMLLSSLQMNMQLFAAHATGTHWIVRDSGVKIWNHLKWGVFNFRCACQFFCAFFQLFAIGIFAHLSSFVMVQFCLHFLDFTIGFLLPLFLHTFTHFCTCICIIFGKFFCAFFKNFVDGIFKMHHY